MYKQSLAEVLSAVSPTSDTVGNDRLESAVTVIKTIKTSSGDFVVAGDEDGVIRIWTTKYASDLMRMFVTLTLQAVRDTRLNHCFRRPCR